MSDPPGDQIASGPAVGFIGLGNLGLAMALRLLDDGFAVTVVDVKDEPVEAARAAGAEVARVPAELGDVDVVCVAVVDDAQAREVVAGPEGVLGAGERGTTVVVHSTIFPATAEELASAAADRGMAILDAPVSGGDQGARAGTLAVMVGGEDEAVARARPVLDSVGASVFHVGALGSGLAAKFANQLMTFANQAAALEAVELARAFGVDEEAVVEVAMAGTADSWCLRNWGFFERVARSYDEAGAAPRNRPWRKDMWDVVTVARDMDLSLPVAGVVSQVAAPMIDGRASRDD